MKAARHHARQARAVGKALKDSAATGFENSSQNSSDLPHAHENVSGANDAGSESDPSRDGESVDKTHVKQKQDVFKSAKTVRDAEFRRSGMAYWRKDTNQERPSDSHYYTDLTSPAGYTWQNPFVTDAASSKRNKQQQMNMVSGDLSNISAIITSNSKNYLSGMYVQKNQPELQGHTFDAYSEPKFAHESVADYPHYKGDWKPENAYQQPSDPEVVAPITASLLSAQSAESAAMFSAATEAVAEHMDLNFAVPTSEAEVTETTSSQPYRPSIIDQAIVEDANSNHLWKLAEPQELDDELSASLHSVESSPQCDQLFEQSAAAAGAMFKGAPGMTAFQPLNAISGTDSISEDYALVQSMNDASEEFNEDESSIQNIDPLSATTQAEQSITLDSLPEQRFVDVRISAADNEETAPEILRALAYDINPDVRFAIAENHNVDAAILRLLTEDQNPYVAHRAKKTLKRLEGGQLKQGSFPETKNSNWLSDRRRAGT